VEVVTDLCPKPQVQSAITKLDVRVGEIQGKKFLKGALNQVFKQFDALYKEAPMEQKREMLKTTQGRN
jgi:calcineurin-like phosphoesterase